tara:strand:+ start:74 stop:415 length:342 start_codon:yes stop_codon:yes gene_type:complete
MERIKYIPKKYKYKEGKRYYKYIKYPTPPLSLNDIYITTTSGDRLDSLAHQFYKNVDFWWIIATANIDIIRRDSYNLKGGLELRIPMDITSMIRNFELDNKETTTLDEAANTE